ncbi:MAG: hypothetical protein KME09_02075 [Pleurocapsa minor HA4230-MV1]|jgi:hypothetical protein|nr:hypothetical protein [Pleurocapsa minor HA4230-MV1]
MFESLLVSSVMLISQLPNAEPEFIQLKTQLESYGFQVNIAIPPDLNLPRQEDGLRRKVRKPYGMFLPMSKSIWINPIVFELGFGQATLIHESVHAAQYCAGNGKLKAIDLDLEPIPQALPFFKRYVDTQRQDLEKEAYTVQSQPNNYELARSLLDHHCQVR